mgnify:CR=1 FL=1
MALDNTTKNGCVCNTNTGIATPSSSKKIIYYKLDSPYREDYTKNCGLVGSEIDSNFFNLKEMDIVGADWDSVAREIVLTRVDGEELRVKGLYETFESQFDKFDFSYNPTSGTLSVVTPFETFNIKGFFTDDKMMMANNDTLVGDGCMSNPLGVASVAQTGTYKPIKAVIDAVEGESTEVTLNKLKPVKGDRFITVENIGKFGRLYEYYGVEKLMKDLQKNASEWRVPSKTDWDVMLTCVEGCVCKAEKTPWHDAVTSNEDLGRVAGQRLRTKDFWKENPIEDTPSTYDAYDADYTYTTEGTDMYKFSVLPLGYGDAHGNPSKGYSRYSAFWTSTAEDMKNDMYTKRFTYDKNTVFQSTTEPTERLSLRLVKTFDGKNFNESEVINGMTYPCVLVTVPSDIKDETIYSIDNNNKTNLYATVWTQINIGFNNPDYLPKTRIADTEWEGKEDFTVRYFVNDWDGKEWTKHELKEGESVVVINEYQGVSMHEWRLMKKENGDSILVDTIASIKEELEETIGKRIDELDEKLNDEIDRAKAAEAELRNDVSALQEEVVRLDGKIDTETERAEAAEKALDEKIESEIERAKEAEGILQENIDAETERAKEAERILQENIDAETERAEAAEKALDEKIESEIERAKEAERILQENIDAEAATRAEEDAKIHNELDNTQLGAGLAEDGSYVSTESNYISDAVSLADANAKLDAALKVEEIERIANDIATYADSKTSEKYMIWANSGLTLKRNNGEKIVISFDGNFGELPLTDVDKNNITISQEVITIETGEQAILFTAYALRPVSSELTVSVNYTDANNENGTIQIVIAEGETTGFYRLMNMSRPTTINGAGVAPETDNDFSYEYTGEVSSEIKCMYTGVYPTNASDEEIVVGVDGVVKNPVNLNGDMYETTVEIPYVQYEGFITDEVMNRYTMDVVIALDNNIKSFTISDGLGSIDEFLTGIVKTVSIEVPNKDGVLVPAIYNVYRLKNDQFVCIGRKPNGSPMPFDIKVKIQK